MEMRLPSSDLYSRPNKLLEDHLIGVLSFIEVFLSEKPEEIKSELGKIAKVMGLLHDIGKATKYFQDYLNADEDKKQKLKNLEETKHSLLSAICTYYICREITKNEFYPIFAFLAVKRHHGDLIDIKDELLPDDKKLKILQKQIESIDENSLTILSNKLFCRGLPFQLGKNLMKEWVNSFNSEVSRLKRNLRKLNLDVKSYITMNLFYSLLLDADKSEVVIGNFESFKRQNYNDVNWVDEYLKVASLPESPINWLRKQAYDEVVNFKIDLSKRIYSLNLPTGLGKTLISLSFALKLKDLLKNNGINARIIYALPFLSIIDQNAKVFEEVILTNKIQPTTDLLLKHHHLSEIYYKTKEDEYETDEARILIEGWNSEIIVTTFVQLFHTLFSNKNSTLRKFHKLANSIIILDEVQAIPVKYWQITREILVALSEMLNSYIIISTATEPLIFSKNETASIVDREKYFYNLNRVELISEINNSLTLNEIQREIELGSDKRILFIFNTINSAREFYRLIKDNGFSMTYLSTHIIPKERLKRIKEIKQKKYKIVISTQLVEAGVDIDFDIVIRDLAPLDSINQSAGRCNRNAKANGIIKVFVLKDKNERTYASYIYDSVLLEITKKILSARNSFSEGEFLKVIQEYYCLASEKKVKTESERILEAISKLKYDKTDENDVSISDFKLIEDDYPKVDVFIEIDDESEKIWLEYQKIKEIKDIFERRNEFLKIRKKFYEYVISIPIDKAQKNLPPEIAGMRYVSKNQLNEYYDVETGYKVNPEIAIW